MSGVLIRRGDQSAPAGGSRWRLSDGFRVLDHPTRRLILSLLNENGPMDFRRLAILLRARSRSISYHLLVLRPYVVKNEDGFYELNELGFDLARFVNDGKKVLEISDPKDGPA